MNLKSRVEELETRMGAGREVVDVFITYIPWPDPDGSIKAAGYQKIQAKDPDKQALLEWSRWDGESQEEFVCRAKREAPTAAPGAYARLFSAEYRERLSVPESAPSTENESRG